MFAGGRDEEEGIEFWLAHIRTMKKERGEERRRA